MLTGDFELNQAYAVETDPKCNRTPVPTTDVGKSDTALTYWQAEKVFLWASFDELYKLKVTGEKTFIGDMESESKGLAFVGSTLYSILRISDELHVIDPTDATTDDTIEINLEDSEENSIGVFGGNGLATDPTTGILYALLQDDESSSGLVLATIDPDTGDALLVGELPYFSFGSIAFKTNGELFATTGFANDVPDSLWTIDKKTAEVTFVCHFGAGFAGQFDGQSLAFNRDNGNLYDARAETFGKLERQIIAPACETRVIKTDDSDGEVTAMTYWPAEGLFLLDNFGHLNSLTPEGDFEDIGDIGKTKKGLAFVGDTLYGIDRSSSVFLVKIDPTVPVEVSSVEITLAGEDVDNANGLASSSGILWGLLKIEGESGRELVTIDPDTGVATSRGNTGDRFSAIAFDRGTLFGVTGDGAGLAETLYRISTSDASAKVFCSLGTGDDGEALAFNPSDGTLYHYSGTSSTFEQITGKKSLQSPIRVALFSIDRFNPVIREIDPETALVLKTTPIISEDLDFEARGPSSNRPSSGARCPACLAETILSCVSDDPVPCGPRRSSPDARGFRDRYRTGRTPLRRPLQSSC